MTRGDTREDEQTIPEFLRIFAHPTTEGIFIRVRKYLWVSGNGVGLNPRSNLSLEGSETAQSPLRGGNGRSEKHRLQVSLSELVVVPEDVFFPELSDTKVLPHAFVDCSIEIS
jgi:hypothetical protein